MKNYNIIVFVSPVIYYELNGLYHRTDGPAIEFACGDKEWFINGLLHREGGPAIKRGKTNFWYIKGSLHRECGPAIEHFSEEQVSFISKPRSYRLGQGIKGIVTGNRIWALNDVKIDVWSQEEFEKYKKTLILK